MFAFLSFVVALLSLYYLGIMVDSYNPDTTYLTPLVILLIYSVLAMIRELKKEPISWLGDYEPYDYYGENRYSTSHQYRSQNNRSYSNNEWMEKYGSRQNRTDENTEYFTVEEKKKQNNEKELTHYPSNSEVREKIKELEKSRWFRFKRGFTSFFGIDITEEYRKPYKVSTKGKVVPINNKEDYNRFTPKNDWKLEREFAEYNAVAKLMNGRSCEISLGDLPVEENSLENNE
jgi:hypothetical protein